jgi:hypothetical protein
LPMVEWYSQEKARSHDCYLAFGCWAGWSNTCVRPRVESTAMFKKQPDCPSDAFATAASPSWVTGRAVAGRGIAPIRGVAVAGGGTGKGTGIVD